MKTEINLENVILMNPVEKKIKIAFFVPSMEGGGAEKIMATLACLFSSNNYSVDLVLGRATGPYLNSLPLDVNIVNLKKNRIITCLLPLIFYLRNARPMVMLSTLDHACMIAVFSKFLSFTPTKVFVRESTAPSQDFKHGKKSLLTYTMRFLVGLSFKMANGVIAVSEGVKSDLVKFYGLSSSKIEIIYNPVVTSEVFAQSKIVPTHEFFKKRELPVILSVGRLSIEKDFPTLIRAFAIVREKIHAKLVILGEGEERAVLEKLIDLLNLNDDVSLPGFVSNPCSYMAFSSVYVLSSLYEGLPNTLIQAMAVGTPMVSTDCKYGPAEILEGGKYGKLVRVGDYLAMAEAIISSLSKSNYGPEEARKLKERSEIFFDQTVFKKYEKYLFFDNY